MIVHPVRSSDLPALIELAHSTGTTGLTALPANEERLGHRVGWAEKSFRGEAERGDTDYTPLYAGVGVDRLTAETDAASVVRQLVPGG